MKLGPIYPLALGAVQRIDALFAIERTINGRSAEERRAVRHEQSAPLVAELETWLREQRDRLSRSHDLAKAIHYMLVRWPSFTRFLDDGRVCLSNNAAERALRGVALGRKAWLFCGSDHGGQRAAVLYSLIVTARMNDVETKLARTLSPNSSSLRARALGARTSQAWKPLRETPSAPQIQDTSQIPRCFATNPNFISSPWQSRPRLFLGCPSLPSS